MYKIELKFKFIINFESYNFHLSIFYGNECLNDLNKIKYDPIQLFTRHTVQLQFRTQYTLSLYTGSKWSSNQLNRIKIEMTQLSRKLHSPYFQRVAFHTTTKSGQKLILILQIPHL